MNLAKPERPSDVKVATVYSNSIELEWRQGGLSDVTHYTVRYRQHPVDPELDKDLDDQEIDDEHVDLDDSSSFAELADYYFKRLNTSMTKVKVGGNFKAFTLYEFRVLAVNMLGSSDETEPLLVRTAATSMRFNTF